MTGRKSDEAPWPWSLGILGIEKRQCLRMALKTRNWRLLGEGYKGERRETTDMPCEWDLCPGQHLARVGIYKACQSIQLKMKPFTPSCSSTLVSKHATYILEIRENNSYRSNAFVIPRACEGVAQNSSNIYFRRA